MKAKLKAFIMNSLGIITTILAIVVMYLILYTQSSINILDEQTWVELTIVGGLSIYCKIFWYKSAESKIRFSEEYKNNEKKVTDCIDEVVTDINDFDKFIDVQNIINYNNYVSSRCKNVTVKNYKLTFGDKLYNLFHKKKKTTLQFFNEYVYSIERKAAKIHKLSSSNITSLSYSNIIDDRNFSKIHKLYSNIIDDSNFSKIHKRNYLTFSTVCSVAFITLLASITFQRKNDVDMLIAFIKLTTYTVSMLFAIIQSVVTANFVIKTDDIAYFRRIIRIIEKYEAYKNKPFTIERVNYIIDEDSKEVENASIKSNSIPDGGPEQLDLFSV